VNRRFAGIDWPLAVPEGIENTAARFLSRTFSADRRRRPPDDRQPTAKCVGLTTVVSKNSFTAPAPPCPFFERPAKPDVDRRLNFYPQTTHSFPPSSGPGKSIFRAKFSLPWIGHNHYI
jgi:hypothetical protein